MSGKDKGLSLIKITALARKANLSDYEKNFIVRSFSYNTPLIKLTQEQINLMKKIIKEESANAIKFLDQFETKK